MCVSATDQLPTGHQRPTAPTVHLIWWLASPNQWSNLGSNAHIVRKYDVKSPQWDDSIQQPRFQGLAKVIECDGHSEHLELYLFKPAIAFTCWQIDVQYLTGHVYTMGHLYSTCFLRHFSIDWQDFFCRLYRNSMGSQINSFWGQIGSWINCFAWNTQKSLENPILNLHLDFFYGGIIHQTHFKIVHL